MDPVVSLQDLPGLDPLPGGAQLDEDPLLAHPELLVERDQLQCLGHLGLRVKLRFGDIKLAGRPFTFFLTDRRASTSVETRPSTTFRISAPKATNILSIAISTY